jgi:hypothetical protein
MRSIVRLLAVVLVASSMNGCYVTKLYFADNDNSRGTTYHLTQQSFFWGILRAGKVNVAGYCSQEGGVRFIKTGITGWGLRANTITAGIWSPIGVTVVCGRSKTSERISDPYGGLLTDADLAEIEAAYGGSADAAAQ